MGLCYMIGRANKQFQSFANINSILEILFELLRFSLFYGYRYSLHVTKFKTNHSDCSLCKPNSLSNLNK